MILIPILKKGSTKECANHQTIALISHVSKVMLKFCMLGFSTIQTKNFQMSKLDLEKEEELEIKLPTFAGLWKKQGNFRKTCISVSSTMLKAFDCVDHDKLRKALREKGTQTILPVSRETCMRVKKQRLEPCMEQLIGSRSRKEYEKSICCHPICLTYTLSAS